MTRGGRSDCSLVLRTVLAHHEALAAQLRSDLSGWVERCEYVFLISSEL